MRRPRLSSTRPSRPGAPPARGDESTTPADQCRLVYGPVPSRRLGLSLGIDLVPYKTCTYDCIYCQLGQTTRKTMRRKRYAPVEAVLSQVEASLVRGPPPAFLTVTGAGEPTLHSELGVIVSELKRCFSIPVTVLTNGVLLADPDVQRDCRPADVVMPTLTTTDPRCFEHIHRPARGATAASLIEGLTGFRRAFRGEIWLELMMLEGLNSADEQVKELRRVVEAIAPERVQVNTVVRPPADLGARRISQRRMQQVLQLLGSKAEAIADYAGPPTDESSTAGVEEVFALVNRRPCRVQDVAAGLGIPSNEVLKWLARLQQDGRIVTRRVEGQCFYQSRSTSADVEVR